MPPPIAVPVTSAQCVVQGLACGAGVSEFDSWQLLALRLRRPTLLRNHIQKAS